MDSSAMNSYPGEEFDDTTLEVTPETLIDFVVSVFSELEFVNAKYHTFA